MEQQVHKKPLKRQKKKTDSKNIADTSDTVEDGIELRSFLDEDVQHLFIEKTFLTQCILSQDPVSLVRKVYFDDAYPKNQVIRVTQEKVEVYQLGKTIGKGKWRLYTIDKLLDDVVNRVHHILNWHKLKNIKEIGRIADIEGYDYEASSLWLDKLYDDVDTRDETKILIKDMLLHK